MSVSFSFAGGVDQSVRFCGTGAVRCSQVPVGECIECTGDVCSEQLDRQRSPPDTVPALLGAIAENLRNIWHVIASAALAPSHGSDSSVDTEDIIAHDRRNQSGEMGGMADEAQSQSHSVPPGRGDEFVSPRLRQRRV